MKKTIFVSVNPVKASVVSNGFHSLALKSDGTLLSWGADGTGQLGDDAQFSDKVTPVSVLLGGFIIGLP
jgi:alpha-tubulin suppressor-like RCC1 family protein